MDNKIAQDVSQLEKDLNELAMPEADDRLAHIRNILFQMADATPRQVIVSTYPACNSEV